MQAIAGLRVLICGPSRLVRQRIRQNIQRVDPNARVVAEAPSPTSAIFLTRRYEPDLVVLAGTDEAGDHTEIVEAIRAATPRRIRIVLVPDRPLRQVGTANAVMPRSRYTNRAMVSVLARIIARG
jgi:DNA-binding NarL/FixJ family response regulator